ncbi:hypothetical protein M2S00_07340, partial [Apilactobacillus sp. TMW 2.2459]|uniref:hypothetical protein n=1 Tax=Apilactobacillus xinyiensis TaxID=2841032 RepID=UPI00200F13D8
MPIINLLYGGIIIQFNKKKLKKINDKKVLKKVKKNWVTVSISTLAVLGGVAAGSTLLSLGNVSADSYNNQISNIKEKSQNSLLESDVISDSGDVKSTAPDSGDVKSTAPDSGDVKSTAPDSGDVKSTASDSGDVKSTASDSGDVKGTAPDSGDVKSTEPDFINRGSLNSNSNSSASFSQIYNSAENGHLNDSNQNDFSFANYYQNYLENEIDNNNYGDFDKSRLEQRTNDNSQILTSDAVNGFNDALNNIHNSNNNSSDYALAYSFATENKDIIEAAASKAYNKQVEGVNSYTSEQQSYYDAASKGVNNAKIQYDYNTTSLGTNDIYENYRPSNSDQLNSSPSLSRSSAKSYEDSMINKYNNSYNTSVRLSNGQSIVIPTSDDVQDRDYVNNTYLDLAYKYGVNYFLSHQGASDAESGKWKGTSAKNGGIMVDNYNPDSKSTNPYDQAYIGANNAIKAQWNVQNNGNIIGFNKNMSLISDNSYGNYYKYGYNDVVKQVNTGTAFVSDAYQFNYVMTQKSVSPSSPLAGRIGYVVADLNNIRFTNDIAFINDNDSTQYVNWSYDDTSKPINLTVDAQNHIADFHGIMYKNSSSRSNDQLTVKNFRTVYANNYYGFVALASQGSTHFSNINYLGGQFLSSLNSSVYLDGSINSFNVNSYLSPVDKKIHLCATSNQENIEAKDVILGANANFFGSTAKTDMGTTVYVNGGNMTLGNNSSMTLIPRGSRGGSSRYGSAYGVYIDGPTSSFNVNRDATLNIIPDYRYINNIQTGSLAGGIIVGGSNMTVRGNVNVMISGDLYSQPVYNTGSISIANGGSFNLQLGNAILYNNNSTSGLIQNVGTFSVYDKGSLKVVANGATNINLICNLNSFIFNNPGQVILDLSKNNNINSSIIAGSKPSIMAYSTKYRIDNNKSFSGNLYSAVYNSVNNGSFVTVDDNGKVLTDNIVPKSYLEFSNVPAPSFVGPIIVSDNTGSKNITFYVKINDLDSNDNKKLYVQYATGNNDNNYSNLNVYPGTVVNPNNNGIDDNYYNQEIDLSNYDSKKLYKITFTIPNSNFTQNINDLGILLRYGVSGDSIVQNINNNADGRDSYGNIISGVYNKESQNITKGSNSKLVLDTVPTVNTDKGYFSIIQDGINDAQKDGYNDNIDSLNQSLYQRNLDYTNAYDDALDGYNSYLDDSDNPNYEGNDDDIYNRPISSNIKNPYAYVQGIQKAKADRFKTQNIAQVDASKPENHSSEYNGRINQVYVNAYNKAIVDYATNRAVSDFNDNNNEQGKASYADNQYASMAYSSAYKDATDGYNKAASDFKSAANFDDSNLSSISSNAYGSAYAAFSKAKNDVYNGASLSSQSSMTNINSLAYKNEFNNLYSAYNSAINNYNSNNSLTSDYSSSDSQANKMYKDTYNLVSSAASQARRDFETISGSNAPSGATLAASTAYSEAYAAVEKAKSDYDAGSSKVNHSYSVVNSLAYGSEYDAFTRAASIAQTDFNDTKPKSNSYDSNNVVANNVYDKAYGHLTDASSQAKSDFQTSGKLSSHGYVGSQADAYNNAYTAYSQAVTDFAQGNGSMQSHGYNAFNSSAYSSEYEQLHAASSAGSLDGTKGSKYSQGSYASDQATSTAYSDAYHKQTQAQIDAASQAVVEFNSNATSLTSYSNSVVQKAYDN